MLIKITGIRGDGMQKFHDKRDWFFERRYGLFLHWGIYSVHGYQEQEVFRRNVPRDTYAAIKDVFNPVKFDPDAWVDTAVKAGFEYIVLTAKHIDGFCMWDTKFTDFNIMNTPYHRDIVKMLSDACRRRGVLFGLYYSVVDMHHKNYPNSGRSYEYPGPQPGDEPDIPKYVRYVKNQITELCTNYGDLCCLFWDGNMPGIMDESVHDIIRRLQPGALINDRGFSKTGDYSTPERDFVADKINIMSEFKTPTEACQAVGTESWGYRIDEKRYSTKYLMQSIAKHLCMGGNYLLNVGPMPDGTLCEKDVVILDRIGAWLSKVKEAFYGTVPANGILTLPSVMMTVRENCAYLCFLNDISAESIVLEPFETVPKKVTLLNTGQILSAVRNQGARPYNQPLENLRILNIPVEKLYDTVPVLKLEFNSLPAFIKSDQ